jgi:hypothetical protein
MLLHRTRNRQYFYLATAIIIVHHIKYLDLIKSDRGGLPGYADALTGALPAKAKFAHIMQIAI